MKFLRESAIFNKKFSERRSVIGGYRNEGMDQWRQVRMDAHTEMTFCVNMFNRNSLANAGVKTMKDFIKGGEIRVKSLDEYSRKKTQNYLNDLDVDIWLDELIENLIKTGNGYLEFEFADSMENVVKKVYPICDSSRIYINCDEYGKPVPIKKLINEDGTQKYVETLNLDEYYIQRLDPQYKVRNAKYFSLKYNQGSMFSQIQVYGIPISKHNMLHIKFGIGDIGIYGRSELASTILDFETLEQIERSIAIIAKHKAVPKDIIRYGSDENPATDDELNDFIIYLESLQKEESAIINKDFKRETISYAGQDINLDYMIKHIKTKLIAGLAPEFAIGVGQGGSKQSNQLVLLSYILSIYSKRKLILKPIQDKIIKPFVDAMGLKDCWLEFGELDFETKVEKTNRVGALWTQNVITLNEVRYETGYPVLESGNVFFTQWQQELITSDAEDNGDDGGSLKKIIEDDAEEVERMNKGSPGANVEEPNQRLPNNDSGDEVFNRRTPPNKSTVQKGRPIDTTKKPKPRLIANESTDFDSMMNDIKMLEKTMTITIETDDIEEKPQGQNIDFKTLMDKFGNIFNEPRNTEIFYKKNIDSYEISFKTTNNMLIVCKFTKDCIVSYFGRDTHVSEEQKQQFVQNWLQQNLQKAIQVK